MHSVFDKIALCERLRGRTTLFVSLITSFQKHKVFTVDSIQVRRQGDWLHEGRRRHRWEIGRRRNPLRLQRRRWTKSAVQVGTQGVGCTNDANDLSARRPECPPLDRTSSSDGERLRAMKSRAQTTLERT